ncbi:hypothetical protein SNEBB_011462 [Seison nebaliae]|nr:hypothetical protein SNEBB_011462 [Seison nebaliae]
MKIKRLGTIAQFDEHKCVRAIAFSSDNRQIAVGFPDRTIRIFDEHGASQSTIHVATTKRDSTILVIEYSPASLQLAVGFSDCMILVYSLEQGKELISKFNNPTPASQMNWLMNNQLITGFMDGKIKRFDIRRNRSATVYTGNTPIIVMRTNFKNSILYSGHVDGTIVRYVIDPDKTSLTNGLLLKHPVAPDAMAVTDQLIVVGGCDRRIVIYNENGGTLQQFNYQNNNSTRTSDKFGFHELQSSQVQDSDHDFTSAVVNPSGQMIIVGSYDKLHIFTWSVNRGLYTETNPIVVDNMYLVSSLLWRRDGARLLVGSSVGRIDMYDCSMKKYKVRDKFEITYVGISQVIVHNKENGDRVNLKSKHKHEIYDIKILHKDSFVVAYTSNSILIGEIHTKLLSEVSWNASAGKHRFYFGIPKVCIIFTQGDLSIVEFGYDEILATVRTEFLSPNQLSIKLNESRNESVKNIAYLTTQHDINIYNVNDDQTIDRISHDSAILWLDLNETSKYLLLKDKRRRLFIYNRDTQEKKLIISLCSFVQWIPNSDVIVAQSRDNLSVWYNVEAPEEVTLVPIDGDIIEVVRNAEQKKTQVVVLEENEKKVTYQLENSLIEFGTAIEDKDFARAIEYLENVEQSVETEAMWRSLSHNGLVDGKLEVVQRCYSALGDVSKAAYMRETIKMVDEIQKNTKVPRDKAMDHYTIRARLEILDHDIQRAENTYLSAKDADKALELYKSLHLWDKVIEVAERSHHKDIEKYKSAYEAWLIETKQFAKAALYKEKLGDLEGAIVLYVKGGLPHKAGQLVLTSEEFTSNTSLVENIIRQLEGVHYFESAGDLYEASNQSREALNAYRKGKNFQKAIDIAQKLDASLIPKIHEEWGDELCHKHNWDVSISHYEKGGAFGKAVIAALHIHSYKRALDILKQMNTEDSKAYYVEIADHYITDREYESAEEVLELTNAFKEAIQMYMKAKKWKDAHRVATNHFDKNSTESIFIKKAEKLIESEELHEAERLFILIDRIDLAIDMFMERKMYDQATHVAKQYKPDAMDDLALKIANKLGEHGDERQAERYYLMVGDWKTASNVYRQHGKWSDALRVAKTHGGNDAAKTVAYAWAKSLPNADSAARMLNKRNMLRDIIEYSIEKGNHDFAFSLANIAAKDQLPTLHLAYAKLLESQNDLKNAEKHYIDAGFTDKAVQMHIRMNNLADAENLASKYGGGLSRTVIAEKARIAFNEGNDKDGEELAIQSGNPKIAIDFYKQKNMWKDSLRVARQHAPEMVAEVERGYGYLEDKSGQGPEGLLEQAVQWELDAEYQKAVDARLRLNMQSGLAKNIVFDNWRYTVELARKWLEKDEQNKAIGSVAEYMEGADQFEKAGEYYTLADRLNDAVNVFIRAKKFDKAKKVADMISKEKGQEVSEKYKNHLSKAGDMKQLAALDADTALEMMAEKHEWSQCIAEAQKHGGELLQKYISKYAVYLIDQNQSNLAVQLYREHGTSANPIYYNLYKKLCYTSLEVRVLHFKSNYRKFAHLRDVLFDLTSQLPTTTDDLKIFQKFLSITHHCAMATAFDGIDVLEEQMGKICISLLRHTDIFPLDSAFYDAGIACRDLNWIPMALIFLNYFLDVFDAIKEHNLDMLDTNAFTGTDIPSEVTIPSKLHIKEEEYEDIKEWILSTSIANDYNRELRTDVRGVFEGTLTANDQTSIECVITGYPVFDDIRFSNGFGANRKDWNDVIRASKANISSELSDCLMFVGKWCGTKLDYK